MRKSWKKLAGLLAASAMLACNVSSVLAANTFDAGVEDVAGNVLFPGDKVQGVAPIYVGNDGTQAAVDETGAFVNDGKTAYLMSAWALDENGGLELDEVGHIITVDGGTVKNADPSVTDDEKNHYRAKDEVEREENKDAHIDVAFYPVDTTVAVTAADAPEGMQFDHWEVDENKVVLQDPTLHEVTFNMVDDQVVIKAVFVPIPVAEEQQPEEVQQPEEIQQPEEVQQQPEEQLQIEDPLQQAPEEAQPDESGVVQIGEEQPAGPELHVVTVENGQGTGTYEVTSNVAVIADVPEGYAFSGWTASSDAVFFADAYSQETTFPMPSEDVTVTANFEQIVTEAPTEAPAVYNVTVVTSELGMITSDAEQATEGQSVTVSAAAIEGYDLTAITATAEDGTPVETQGTDMAGVVSFVMPAQNVLVGAEFAQQQTETQPQTETEPQTETQAPTEAQTETQVQTETEAQTELAETEPPTPPATEEQQTETQAPTEAQTETQAPTEAQTETQAQTDLAQPVQYTVNVSGENTTLTADGAAQTLPAQLDEGKSVTVSASAPAGKQFAGWTVTEGTVEGQDLTQPTITFQLKGNTSLTANYTDVAYSITLGQNLTASGTTAVSGSVVTIAADKLDGQDLTGISAVDSDGNAVALTDTADAYTRTFVMPAADVTVTATYSAIPTYAVTVTNGSGAGNYAQGVTVTIKANAAPEGKKFDYWEVSSGAATLADMTAATTTFVMPAGAVNVKAIYKTTGYKLTVASGSGDGTYQKGSNVTVTADYPAAEKEFDYWELTSGTGTLADKTRATTTFTMPGEAAKITAVYKPGPMASDDNIAGIDAGGEYLKSSTITFKANGAGMENTNPNPGDYRFRPTGYQIGSVTGGWSDSSYTTSMSINAVGQYTLTVTYTREVWNGSSWAADGNTDTKSVTFNVVNQLSVETGDTTPIIAMAALMLIALLLIIVVVVLRIRKRK